MIAVDGAQFDFPCSIRRTARILSSDVSGMLMNNIEFNDVLATYYDYSVKIVVPVQDMSRYYTFFEAVSAPVSSHVFTFPYNGETIDVTAKVESISDVYYREVDGVRVWRDIQIEIHAIEPSKEA